MHLWGWFWNRKCSFLVLSLAAIGLMFAPENFEFYVNYIQALDLPRPLLATGKMLFAWPFVYHTFNGIRHLVSLWNFTIICIIEKKITRVANENPGLEKTSNPCFSLGIEPLTIWSAVRFSNHWNSSTQTAPWRKFHEQFYIGHSYFTCTLFQFIWEFLFVNIPFHMWNMLSSPRSHMWDF